MNEFTLFIIDVGFFCICLRNRIPNLTTNIATNYVLVEGVYKKNCTTDNEAQKITPTLKLLVLRYLYKKLETTRYK
jgi:hypothetical protein